MGPGDRFQAAIMPGIGFGVQYARWPYTHQIMIQFLCFSFSIGLGPSYIDDNYKG